MKREHVLGVFGGTAIAFTLSMVVLVAMAIPLLSPPPRSEPTPSLGTVADLTFDVSTDKKEYTPGELVHLTGILRNRASSPVMLSQATSCGYAFASVENSTGATVWVDPSVHNQYCFPVVVETPLGPGESRTFHVAWDQTDAAGAAVPSDESYRAVYVVGYLEGIFEDDVLLYIRGSD